MVRDKAKQYSRQYAWQKEQIKLGKCVKCSAKRISARYCLKHLIYNRENTRKLKHCKERREGALSYRCEHGLKTGECFKCNGE